MGPYWQEELTKGILLKQVIIFSFIKIIRSNCQEVGRKNGVRYENHLWLCMFDVCSESQDGARKERGSPCRYSSSTWKTVRMYTVALIRASLCSPDRLGRLPLPRHWLPEPLHTRACARTHTHTLFKTSMLLESQDLKRYSNVYSFCNGFLFLDQEAFRGLHWNRI